jgi:hypothetical protein
MPLEALYHCHYAVMMALQHEAVYYSVHLGKHKYFCLMFYESTCTINKRLYVSGVHPGKCNLSTHRDAGQPLSVSWRLSPPVSKNHAASSGAHNLQDTTALVGAGLHTSGALYRHK